MKKDKVVEGIEKIILKSFYATSKELAQAIKDSLVLDEDKIEIAMADLGFENGEKQVQEVEKKGLWSADLITTSLRDLAKKIAKANVITIKGEKCFTKIK